MLSFSVRRVSLTAGSASIVCSLSSFAPRAAASHTFSYRSHQRRLSSSKPSSPADGSEGVVESVSAAHVGAGPNSEKKSKSSKRKAKGDEASSGLKGRHESMQNLPSVPSTQHISPTHISASDFFSLYRPISLTSSFPKSVTDDAFAAIFTPRTSANKPSEVISMISSTLDKLDSVTGNMMKLKVGSQQDQWNEETDELRASITAESYRKAETHHLDNSQEDSVMNFPKHILSGKYRPFHPPPRPIPIDTPASIAAGVGPADTQELQQRTYTSILTIEESTDSNGDITYMAHSSPLVSNGRPVTPTRFLGRMQIRQERYREHRGEDTGMLAISVKRQRKLKMKKHKYKKLMRRTRNLRRRLDRN